MNIHSFTCRGTFDWNLQYFIKFRKCSNNIQCICGNFSIIECTRNSKRYWYTGERQELDEPMEVIIGPKKHLSTTVKEGLSDLSDDELSDLGLKRIKYNYNNKVMKDKTAHIVA